MFVTKGNQILQNFPEAHVKQVILFGNAQLTTQAMAYCLDQQIDVAFMSQAGSYRGRLLGTWPRSAGLRQRQYARSLDPAFRLRQAQACVTGKVLNLMAFARRQQVSEKAADFLALRQYPEKIAQARDLDVLMGLEGSASAAYFRMFRGWIPRTFKFTNRVAHPPGDEVNALLSLGYTLLYNRFIAVINLVGLDPYQGYLHAQRSGHAALASDLMEEFRPLICDALVIKLLRLKMIKPGDFARQAKRYELQPPALSVYFRAFEERLDSRRQNAANEELNLTYRQSIERQVRHFARVIAGEEERYEPFAWR
jgi:CRISPR-associated protein Cas1